MEQRDFIEQLFNLLISNKRFPNYQAERRIDIFINYFLERILSTYLEKPATYICPEFPLLKVKEDDKPVINRTNSNKVDYLCAADRDIFYVELKTNKGTIKKNQLDIYLKNLNWRATLENFKKIVDLPRDDKDYQNKYNALGNKIYNSNITHFNEKIRLIYLSPTLIKESDTHKLGTAKRFIDLKFKMTEPEQQVWEYLCSEELDMKVFEIIAK